MELLGNWLINVLYWMPVDFFIKKHPNFKLILCIYRLRCSVPYISRELAKELTLDGILMPAGSVVHVILVSYCF